VLLLALLLATLSPAQAHLPHDQVTALLVPPDLDASVPWFAVVDPVVSDLLLRSDDGGWMWTPVGGGPTVDRARGGTMLADGTPVLLGQAGLWWSDDQGSAWSYAALEGDATGVASVGGTLFVGTSTGVLTGVPGALDGAELEGRSVQALHVDGDVLTAVTLGGGVAVRAADGLWTELGSPGAGARSAAWDAARGVVYAGDLANEVWVHDGEGWAPCGALPDTAWPGVFELAVIDGSLLVATRDGGPFVSDDGCASFDDRRGMFVENTGEGSVAAPDLAVVGFFGRGDAWLVAGWDGLTRTEDRGATWSERALMPIDYTRSVAFDPDFDRTGRVFIGSYAGGPVVALDGGATYFATGFGMNRTNSQVVEAAPGSSTQVYAIVGHSPWRSRDGGESWEITSQDFVPALDQAVTGPTSLWLAGLTQDVAGTDVTWTEDAGRRWLAVAGVEDALAGSIPAQVDVFAVDGEADRVFVAGTVPVRLVRSLDGGESWAEVYAADADVVEVTGVVAWPPDAPTRVLAGVGPELIASDDWGEGWRVAWQPAPDTVLELVVADDGTLVAGLQSGRVAVSDDGGESWEDLGVQLSSAVRSLSARPGFAGDDVVLVGTSDGIYAVHDVRIGAGRAERWGAWQILDESAPELGCPTCPEGEKVEESYPGAARDQVVRLEPGMVLQATLRGERIRVLGAVDGSGAATVEVGQPRLPGVVQTLGGDLADIGLLAEIEVSEGWHEVEIRGVSGTGIVIDALEGVSDTPPLAWDGGAGDTGAGDGGGTDAGGAGDGGTGDGGAADGGAADGGSGTGTGATDNAACGACSTGSATAGLAWLPLVVGIRRRRR